MSVNSMMVVENEIQPQIWMVIKKASENQRLKNKKVIQTGTLI